MKRLIVALTGTLLIISCAARGSDSVVTSLVEDREFAYLLTHARIESESPLTHFLPPGSKYSYRILGVHQQGNCVDGCPPSTIYVATFNYYNARDGRVQVCRIDGLRFYSRVKIKMYEPTEVSGADFLVFEVRSNPEPRLWELYEIRVSPSGCEASFLRAQRSGG